MQFSIFNSRTSGFVTTPFPPTSQYHEVAPISRYRSFSGGNEVKIALRDFSNHRTHGTCFAQPYECTLIFNRLIKSHSSAWNFYNIYMQIRAPFHKLCCSLLWEEMNQRVRGKNLIYFCASKKKRARCAVYPRGFHAHSLAHWFFQHSS